MYIFKTTVSVIADGLCVGCSGVERKHPQESNQEAQGLRSTPLTTRLREKQISAFQGVWSNMLGVPHTVYRFLGTTPQSSRLDLLLHSITMQIAEVNYLHVENIIPIRKIHCPNRQINLQHEYSKVRLETDGLFITRSTTALLHHDDQHNNTSYWSSCCCCAVCHSVSS